VLYHIRNPSLYGICPSSRVVVVVVVVDDDDDKNNSYIETTHSYPVH
jgi:hypothetical protein